MCGNDMIVVYAGDRTWRASLDLALRQHGLTVRTASRPAELAKCLTAASGAASTLLVIVGSAPDDHTVAANAVAKLAPQLTADRFLNTTPAETIESIVRRANVLIAR